MDQLARPSTDKGAKKVSLAEQVYMRLRTEILHCQLPPGTELSEAELAARFEMSKTPVREALVTLRQEGLVLTFPRRGYQVAPITFGDMNELFDLRIMLEAGAVELACQRITDAQVARLSELARATYNRDEEPTIDSFIAANRDFHLAIARTADNGRLYDLLERQIMELERFFYIGAQLRDVNSETSTDHNEIVAALSERNVNGARELMIRHNDTTRQGLMQVLTRAPKGFSITI